MKNKLNIVVVCIAMTAILVSCDGKAGSGVKTDDLKNTLWLEDYGVRDIYYPMSGLSQAEIYFNLIVIDEEGKMGISVYDNEYDFFGKEFDVDKENVLTIYQHPKADVLPIKDKQPAQWLYMKDDLIITGQFKDDTITLPSKLRDKNGERVFKKSSHEEYLELQASLEPEFARREEENRKEAEKYHSMWK